MGELEGGMREGEEVEEEKEKVKREKKGRVARRGQRQ